MNNDELKAQMKIMKELMGMNDPIREYQAMLGELSLTSDRMRPLLTACQDALQRWDGAGSVAFGKRTPFNPKVEVIVNVDQLEELVPLFRELAKEGFRSDKNKVFEDIKLADIIPMRIYDLGPVQVVAMVVGAMAEDHEGCRMVQTGVKEVPVFEMQCDDKKVE